jgi:hypothetical protein
MPPPLPIPPLPIPPVPIPPPFWSIMAKALPETNKLTSRVRIANLFFMFRSFHVVAHELT